MKVPPLVRFFIDTLRTIKVKAKISLEPRYPGNIQTKELE